VTATTLAVRANVVTYATTSDGTVTRVYEPAEPLRDHRAVAALALGLAYSHLDRSAAPSTISPASSTTRPRCSPVPASSSTPRCAPGWAPRRRSGEASALGWRPATARGVEDQPDGRGHHDRVEHHLDDHGQP